MKVGPENPDDIKNLLRFDFLIQQQFHPHLLRFQIFLQFVALPLLQMSFSSFSTDILAIEFFQNYSRTSGVTVGTGIL